MAFCKIDSSNREKKNIVHCSSAMQARIPFEDGTFGNSLLCRGRSWLATPNGASCVSGACSVCKKEMQLVLRIQ